MDKFWSWMEANDWAYKHVLTNPFSQDKKEQWVIRFPNAGVIVREDEDAQLLIGFMIHYLEEKNIKYYWDIGVGIDSIFSCLKLTIEGKISIVE